MAILLELTKDHSSKKGLPLRRAKVTKERERCDMRNRAKIGRLAKEENRLFCKTLWRVKTTGRNKVIGMGFDHMTFGVFTQRSHCKTSARSH